MPWRATAWLVIALVAFGCAPPPASVKPGSPAPYFQGFAPDGSLVKLSDFRGKVVVLNFWATWCRPCLMEIPELKRLAKSIDGRPAVIVGISAEDDPVWVGNAAAKLGITWPTVIDGMGGPVMRLYGVSGIPQTFLIDANGVIRGRYMLAEGGKIKGVDPEGDDLGGAVEAMLPPRPEAPAAKGG
jgi:peroxiredoxin